MIKQFMSSAVVVLGLAACASELAPEQKAVQRTNWVKTANAAVPACVAAIESRPRNYATFRELGYTLINPVFDKTADVFNAPELTALNKRGTSFRFAPGEGCSANYAFEHNSTAEIVSLWLSAMKANGYQVQLIGDGKYTFSANGKRFTMSAYQRATAGQYDEPASIIIISP